MSAPILAVPAWFTGALGTVGLGAGAVTMVPQISKIVNDKSAKGTSWAMATINGFGTSILLVFCGATVTIFGVAPIALGLGITTLTLAGIRTIAGITLIGMKYHYDYKYLDKKINLITRLIKDFSKITESNNTYLLGLIEEIETSRSQTIGKRRISNKQANELTKNAIDNFIKIINSLEKMDQENKLNNKEKEIANKIKKEITDLLFAGKYYQSASSEMKDLVAQHEKVKEIFNKLSNNEATKKTFNDLNTKIDNFKKLIDQLDNLKNEKNKRLGRNVIVRAGKKFFKDTVPFAFGGDLKKLNQEISKKMNEISQAKDQLKKIVNYIGENHFDSLDANYKNIMIVIASDLYKNEIQEAIKNNELQIVNSDQLKQLSEAINQISNDNSIQQDPLSDVDIDKQENQNKLKKPNNEITLTEEKLTNLRAEMNKLQHPVLFNFQDTSNLKNEKTV